MPTNNILFKTRMISFKGESGTMFSVDVDDREYWLTAKHILTGRKTEPAGEVNEKSVSLEVLDPIGDAMRWRPIEFAVLDPGKDVDIVVLVPKTKLQEIDIPSLKVATGDFLFGGECSFVGYPYASDWAVPFGSTAYKMPFIKHCYISGMIVEPIKMLVLDGINNSGFSGGPLLYNTGKSQVVIGVIAGYYPERGEVHSIEVPDTSTGARTRRNQRVVETRKKKESSFVVLNSGLVYAYMLDSTLAAIRENPMGQPITNRRY